MPRPWGYPEILSLPLILLAGDEQPLRGTWWLMADSDGGDPVTWICCPACKHSAPLTHHVVDEWGMVQGMVTCQLSACGWSYRIHLENR